MTKVKQDEKEGQMPRETKVLDESEGENVPFRYSITSYGADYPVDMDSAIHNSPSHAASICSWTGPTRSRPVRRNLSYSIVTALANNGRVNRPGRCRPRNHCFTVISLTAHPRTASARRNCGRVRPARLRYNARQGGSRGGNSFFRLIGSFSGTTAVPDGPRFQTAR